MRAAVLFLFRRPKLSCVCFDFHRAPSAALHLPVAGTRHISPASDGTKTTQKLPLSLASVFFGASRPTGRLLESIFRTDRGWGVRREFERRKKKASGVGVSTRSDEELATIGFSC